MSTRGISFHHPFAFWLGCAGITAGVLAHIPMFMHAAHMHYHMAGMPMDTTMLVGMGLIPLGLVLATYGLMPRMSDLVSPGDVQFHVADRLPLNCEHWKLVLVLVVTVAVDVMKPATLGFVMPGMTEEYEITSKSAGTLALVALTGTTLGSVMWGLVADRFGRRAAVLLGALMFIGTAICGAMPSFEWNLIMCFLMGLSAGGLLPITFALMAETIPAAHRGWLLVALGGVGTAGGYLLASGAAALLEPMFSWRILWMLGLPTGLLVIFLNRYIPESPRYLAGRGMAGEARAVLARFAGQGGQRGSAVSADVVEETVPAQAPGGIRQLLSGSYGAITLGLVAAGLAWGLVNFGFLLWLPTNLRELGIAENADALLARSATIALPGVLLVIWLYHRWSSIYTLATFIAFTAIALLAFSLCLWFGFHALWTIAAVTALLLVSASGVIAMLIPYAAEIYPVHLRGTGAGLVAASSKAGGILGAGVGVLGLFENMALAALVIALPLLAAAAGLWRNGIDTRGLRLEDIGQLLAMRKRRTGARLESGTGAEEASA
ncbi:MFS transporter [Microbulbifer harenosus]|uniref:MFS transporter n=1 Tax=Microbulbifer harenosus TaxID=2576840 RepID=A0ABY2UDN7_9GAMM|nr:MFS transporter [Microbulbifer harenosus]TLM74789.1 MFS transporter [Microbulbifer harenosus]